MPTKFVPSVVFALGCSTWLLGCGAPAPAPEQGAGESDVGSARLELNTVGATTHATYRLGPATFTISAASEHSSFVPLSVSADGSQDTLDVPLDAEAYTVKLEPGWVLKRSFESSPFTDVEATLLSTNPQSFLVSYLHKTPLHFDFALGVSGATIGIGVDEGDQRPPGYIPDGYDGAIERVTNGYGIVFATGGGACCVLTPADAQAAYPAKKLYVRP